MGRAVRSDLAEALPAPRTPPRLPKQKVCSWRATGFEPVTMRTQNAYAKPLHQAPKQPEMGQTASLYLEVSGSPWGVSQERNGGVVRLATKVRIDSEQAGLYQQHTQHFTCFCVLLCVNTPATLVPGVYLCGEWVMTDPTPPSGTHGPTSPRVLKSIQITSSGP